MQWPTSERRKPIKDHKIITGTLFEMADEAVAFVLDKLEKWIGLWYRWIVDREIARMKRSESK